MKREFTFINFTDSFQLPILVTEEADSIPSPLPESFFPLFRSSTFSFGWRCGVEHIRLLLTSDIFD